MSESINELYDKGLEKYQAGEPIEDLIAYFRDLRDRAPKNSAIWCSLAWLYLLGDKPNAAVKAAQKSVKLDKKAPQARINLAIALLESGQSGVREQIDAAQEMLSLSSEIKQEVIKNLDDGLARKPDWKSVSRVKSWIS
ncbi:MAG: tetratricopeptide repeat protein [Halothece sp.]|jgi:predicted Zn-dependent protease